MKKLLVITLTVFLLLTGFTAAAQTPECPKNSSDTCVSQTPPVDQDIALIIIAGMLIFTASLYHHHLKEKEKRKD